MINIEPSFEIKKIPNTIIDTLDIEYIFKNKHNPLFENFNCVFCTLIVKNPVKCSKCSNIYCKKCVTDYKERFQNFGCPKCKEELKEEKIDFNLKNILNSIITINCENCKKDIPFDDIESHFTEKCESINKIFVCNLCKEEILIEENNMNKINIHKVICPELEFKCGKCKKIEKKSIMKNHLNECEGRSFPCNQCNNNVNERYSKFHREIICENLNILDGIKKKISEI